MHRCATLARVLSERLQERPEAEVRSVEKLLSRVRSGQIRVPHFQRSLRWRTHHIIELFDSIKRGFPIGELLFSKQEAPAETLHFGPVVVDAPKRSDALFIVDGQQRIVSLAGVLLHPDSDPRGGIHAIWYDLEDESFVRRTKATTPPHWLPLREVLDSKALLKWLNDWPLRNERSDLVDRAIELGQAIREYDVPAYIVHDAKDSTLRLIFNRINTSGVRMTEPEVFDALYGTSGRKPVIEACARIAEEGFGEVNPKWFIRCLKAVGGIEPKRKTSELDLERDSPLVAMTETALRRALVFLATHASIPFIDFLPYRLPLIILTKFFHVHSEPTVRSLTLLSYWLWRGALGGEHSASSDAEIRRLTSLISVHEGDSVQALLKTIEKHGKESKFPNPAEPWRATGAKTRLLALALLSLQPIDPQTGQLFGSDEFLLGADPAHALIDIEDPKRRSGPFAGFVVLPAPSLEAQRVALEKLLESPPEVLRSHALTPDMVAAARIKDIDRLLTLRTERLNEFIQEFFVERSGVLENLRPSITDIIAKVRSTG